MPTDQSKPVEEFSPEKHFAENPLLNFSLYSDFQSKIVLKLGDEILGEMSSWPDNFDGAKITEAYNQFWLWVLASYEVVRTMAYARDCFSKPLADELVILRDKIRVIRVPFAKQQLPLLRGQKTKEAEAVYAEPSMTGLHRNPPDMKFCVRGDEISASQLIGHFAAVFRSITERDIVASLPVGKPREI